MTTMGECVTDVGIDKTLVKHELKKHAATIHCSNTLSLLQRKISNALLYHAYKELLIKEEHNISIKQLCNLISYNGHNHAAIKEALKGLISTVIEWNVVNDTTGSEDWTASSIIASVSLQGPTCYYAYSPRMKQLLYSPTMFGKINLYIQSRFKSSYGLALYENCIRYRGLPYTKWFDMETFRKLMGVPQNNYTIFRDFKRRVLDKSIEEVNTYSDLLVEAELARERRQVAKIRFILKDRAKRTRLGTPALDEKESDELIQVRSELINNYSLSPKQTETVLRNYSTDYIKEKLTIVQQSKNYQSGKIKNIAAYVLSALKNDFKQPQGSDEFVKQKRNEENRILLNLKELKRMAEEVEEAYAAYRENTLDEAIVALPKAQKDHLMQQFRLYAAVSIKTILKLQRKRYTEANILNSPQIKGMLRQFALQTVSSIREKLIPIEQFVLKFSKEQQEAWYRHKLLEPQACF